MNNNSTKNGNHPADPFVSSDSPKNTTEEEEYLNWESEMVKLLGLTEEYPSTAEDENSKRQEEFIDDNPQLNTKENFASNPFAKLGLVGSITFLFILFAGLFLSQITTSNHQKPKQNLNISEEQKSPLSEFTATSKEIDSLKTKLALSHQVEAVEAAQQLLRRNKVDLSPTQTPKGIQSFNKTQIVYVPKIVTVERIVKIPQVVNIPIKPKSIKNVNAPTIKTNSLLATRPSVTTNIPAVPIPQNRRTPDVLKQFEERSSTSSSSSSIPILLQSVAAGTTVKAVLSTAVFGETTTTRNVKSNDEQEKNTFIVRLQQPLKAVNESIVLPKDTEVLAEVSSFTEQGLVHLAVVKVFIKVNGNLTQKMIPKNAMIIRAAEGKPLIASQFPNRSDSITGMDLGSLTLGGIGKVASLYNRSQAQITTSNVAGTIVTNTNPAPDILMGLIEGGTSSVIPQITQRNQQEISQMMQRTNIWFIPAGTEVEVYVNQLVQF